VRVESLPDLIDSVNREIAMLEEQNAPYFAGDLGYHAVQAIPGVGPVLAAIFVAEIGDVSRFTSARHLCSWAGLTPTHKESDVTVHRGHITKQGSRLVRWAAVEAVVRQRGDTAIRRHHRNVGERRGTQIGRVAAARKLLILVLLPSERKRSSLDTPTWPGSSSGRAYRTSRRRGDTHSDLHIATAHSYFFDHEPQQRLALIEVQLFERVDNPLRKGGDAGAQTGCRG